MTPDSITCPVCQMTSWHPADVGEGYCGHCHDWTSSGVCPMCGEQAVDYRIGASPRGVCQRCGWTSVKADPRA
jgi:hypothetical protein